MATNAGTTIDPRYTKVAIWLHWLIGLAVIVNIGLAMLTEDMPREAHRAAMGVHKALGMSVTGGALNGDGLVLGVDAIDAADP